MLLVKKYFCFELLTTGMVVGWFGLAESIGWFITSIMILVKYDQLFNPDNYPNTDMRKLSPFIMTILATHTAVNLIDILTSAMLIVGTTKRNRLYLLPWLINGAMSIIFSFVASFVIIVVSIHNAENEKSIVFIFISLFIALNFYIYTWVAIYSLYNLIRRSQPNNEYTSLIEDSGATGNPIYTRT